MAKSFDVTPLAFGINGFEGETRFSAPARTGDDGQFSEREIEIDPLEIVLARAANLDATALCQRSQARFFGFL